MVTLLDVNVLIALADARHVHHAPAKRYLSDIHMQGWATCPITENGFLRMLGRPESDSGLQSVDEARLLLNSLKAVPGHQFWPDGISLCDTSLFPRLPGSRELTDLYLLALAVKNEGRLATFDRGIKAQPSLGGQAALTHIPADQD
jgi:uncharacterized protein